MKRETWGGTRRREGFGGYIVAAAALALASCAHTPPPEPRLETVEVKVPVPVPCKADVQVHQTYSDAAAEFMNDIYDQAKALLAGRDERKADAERLKGAVTGCGGTVK